MSKTSIIDQLPLKEAVKKRLADVVREEQRDPDEIAAALIEAGLTEDDYVLEMAREGDASAAAGGVGISNEDMLQYLEQIAEGNHSAVFPKRTIPY